MNAAAAAAADFKTSFSPQFNGLMQPFGAADVAALFAPGYAPTYNSWAGKVPSPLAGSAKSFPWGVNMSPLTAGFNHAPVSQMVMNTSSTIGMPSVATMSNSALQAAGPATHNYSNITSTFSPSNPYAPYREQCGPPPPPPPPVVSSVPTTSAASGGSNTGGLRFNSTKTNSSSSSTSSTASSGSSLLSGSPRSSSTLTACQFAGGADRSPV